LGKVGKNMVILELIYLRNIERLGDWFYGFELEGVESKRHHLELLILLSWFEEMVVIVGVPLLPWLAWNRWAGGASSVLLNVTFCFVGFKFAY
jgi:hypothetical protein